MQFPRVSARAGRKWEDGSELGGVSWRGSCRVIGYVMLDGRFMIMGWTGGGFSWVWRWGLLGRLDIAGCGCYRPKHMCLLSGFAPIQRRRMKGGWQWVGGSVL